MTRAVATIGMPMEQSVVPRATLLLSREFFKRQFVIADELEKHIPLWAENILRGVWDRTVLRLPRL